MRIVNTSHWPDHYIHRMLAWCIQQVDVPRDRLRAAQFRNRTTKPYSGRAHWSGRIVVSINPDASCYPIQHAGYKRACRPNDGSDYPLLVDPVETLVIVTAHEIGHIAHFSRGHYGRGSEDIADARARYVLRKFREQRAELEAAWSIAPVVKPRPPVQEQRAAKAAAMLAAWQRRLKLAKSKVVKYGRRVRYYTRAAACRS